MSSLSLIPCPLCGNSAKFLDVPGHRPDGHIAKYGDLYAGASVSQWKVCGICGFVHQNPCPSAAALNAFYANSEYHEPTGIPDILKDPKQFLKAAQEWYGDKIAYLKRITGLTGGRTFDLGCGHGGYMRLMQDAEWEAFGCEPDADLAAFARKVAGVVNIDRELLTAAYDAPGDIDVVFSNHTFEHVADLNDAMTAIRNMVVPGSYIFTVVPTYYKNRTPMSLEWMNSAHYSIFTHSSLDQMCARYGFEPVAHTYRGNMWQLDEVWHIARMSGKADPKAYYENPAAVRKYITVTNPINSALYSPIYSVAGQNVRRIAGIGAYHLKTLVTRPGEFGRKIAKRLSGKRAGG